MIKKLYHNLLLFSTLFLVAIVSGQNKTSTEFNGKVTSTEGEALNGATVSSNTGQLAFTDENGVFTIASKGLTHITVALENYQTQIIAVLEDMGDLDVVLVKNEDFLGKENEVHIPFGTLEKRRIVGSVAAINVEEHLEDDQRIFVGAAINGKVGGVFNNQDVLGLGPAIYVIDGIPRDPSIVNLTEIEEITVLKDAVSRVLYGAAADQGVILITTKRGVPFKKDFSVRLDYSIQSPRTLPEYLGAADYMEAFNQARANDGLDAQFTPEQITGTRNGTDPLRFPDADYLSNTFIQNSISVLDVNMEAAGGTEVANYYLNMGFNNTEGWLNLGENDVTNRFNIRANTDYKLSDRLNVSLDAVAVFDFDVSPDVFTIDNQFNNNDNIFATTGDFWTTAQTALPNAFPLLIPISGIADPASYANANLVDGQFLLGGTNEFTQNIYGDLLQNGRKNTNSRYIQINTGLDWDLGFITEGLSASADVTFDFLNRTVENQNTDYAVYEPLFLTDATGADSLSVRRIGADILSNERGISADESFFRRRIGAFGTLKYKKDWADNKLDVTALLYLDQLTLPSVFVDEKSLNYGIRANYMLKDKYVAEFGGLMVGSRRLPLEDNYAFSPTFGLGWIISEEDYFGKDGAIDYLKLRGTIGLLQNDNWQDNFLYETSFTPGGFFNYGNTSGSGAIRNRELNFVNVANQIGFQKRREYNLGFEGLFFNRKLYFEASYFNSRSFDIITPLNFTTPDLLGYTITTNNNAFVDRGVEANLRYKKNFNNGLKMTLTASGIRAIGKVDAIDEPIYISDTDARIRLGRRSDAIFGLRADGLYGASDFNVDGTLVAGLPRPTFGAVQPGDIKYVDINGDGTITNDDQVEIGNNSPNHQYSFTLNLEFKNFEFFMLGIGQYGQERLRNGDYFWTSGNQKYAAHALDAYGPGNENVNATIPRLSFNNNGNNFRNSSYWIYKNNSFSIPAMQVSYNYVPKKLGSVVKAMKFFVRANDLIIINPNRELNELRFGVGSTPLTRGASFGLVTSF